MIGSVGASQIAAILVVASCILAAAFLVLREKYRRAMLTEKLRDHAEGNSSKWDAPVVPPIDVPVFHVKESGVDRP